MKIATLEDVAKKKLVQLTDWLFQKDFDWLQSERERILTVNPKRKAEVVEHRGRRALYVDDVANSKQ